MGTITVRKTRKIEDFRNEKGKRTFLVRNILLCTGLIAIVSALFYVLINLEQPDRIIHRCLPIIALGLVFVSCYIIGCYKLPAKHTSYMRHNASLIVVFLFFLLSCKKEDNKIVTTPLNIYKIFWDDFNANYPAFQLNNINWDSVYSVNSAMINSNTTDYTLFNIIKSSVLALKDAHSDISSNQYGRADYGYVFVQQKPANFPVWNTIFTKYVQKYKFNHSNATMAYGKVYNQDIGYFLIESFNEIENDYYMIDSFLDNFQNSKAIIIDIRHNGGGNESYAQIVASRLTNQAVTYRYARYRIGPENSDLSDYIPLKLYPNGKIRFTKPVILLTNRHTFSAAEDFTLMLRSFPNIVQIGDTTLGGVATNPIIKTLPNGWTYRMARTINCDKSKAPIKGGIAPQVEVQISKQDSINGVDKIIEAAIDKINEKME
ncbi:MAG: S41 family peptidase [Bacteroidetes bacterium]|nr:S41 family peptidase [Bacteroidota bacterium]